MNRAHAESRPYIDKFMESFPQAKPYVGEGVSKKK